MVLSDEYRIPETWELRVQDGANVEKGDILASRGRASIVAMHAGCVTIGKGKVIVSFPVTWDLLLEAVREPEIDRIDYRLKRRKK